MSKQHAKKRPPSSAARWLSCPGSVNVMPLYPNDVSAASEKGDHAHDVLESCMLFGIEPNSDDPDVNENISLALDWIYERRKHYGPDCQVYAERSFSIPETGEFGTTDVTFVTPKLIHIADYKNGYVPVDVSRNGQMMTYLCGAIAEFGERDRYLISVIQPNYNHIDGPIRTYELDADDLWRFRKEIEFSMKNEDKFIAGKHCKKSYCPHRGGCKSFLEFAKDNARVAWFPSDVNALTDEELSEALDHADTLQGIRDELRKEAMRRVANQDRHIDGYKLVKGKNNREISDKDAIKRKFGEIGIPEQALYNDPVFVSAKGVEDAIKAYAQKNKLPRGAWKQIYDNNVREYIRDFAGGLTLERAIDGRPAHKRGSEFGAIAPPDQPLQVAQII